MTDSTREVQTQSVHVNADTFICPSCGGLMKFDVKSQKFICSSCRAEQDLESLSDTVREYDFSQYLEREKTSVPFEGMAVVTCQNCGLEMTLDTNQVSAACPMCASAHIVSIKQNAGIAPEGIVPFKIDKYDAQSLFRTWVKSRWFAPGDFKKKYGEGDLKGLYLPFWTYDASVVSHYKGKGGKQRKVKDKDGNEKTVTDWYPVSGIVTSLFDDIQICASEKEKNIEGVLPYNTIKNSKPYSAGYLAGYYTEIYKIKADKAFERAKNIMESEMRSLVRKKILNQYDICKIESIKTTYSNVTYKHMLLPLWSSAFGYNGKTYGYLINGETGKVSGERPYSAGKIAAAIAAAATALIIGVVLFFNAEELFDLDLHTDTETFYAVQSYEESDVYGHNQFFFEINENGRF